jgi:hypothetical protein
MADEEYVSIDLKTENLIKCYQIQLHNNIPTPILLGKYHELPLPINLNMKYKNHKLFVVTYILTEDEITNKLYKFIGIQFIPDDKDKPSYILDMIYDVEKKVYQYILINVDTEKELIIKEFTEPPKKDLFIEELMKLLDNEEVIKIF